MGGGGGGRKAGDKGRSGRGSITYPSLANTSQTQDLFTVFLNGHLSNLQRNDLLTLELLSYEQKNESLYCLVTCLFTHMMKLSCRLPGI